MALSRTVHPISEAEPGLYIGDMGSSHDPKLLSENRINAMLSLSDGKSPMWEQPATRDYVPAEKHMYIRCFDTSVGDLLVYMATVCAFIEENQRPDDNPPRNVLVHCTRGKSRSATFVTAYLMKKHRLPLHTVLPFLQERRKVQPNANFMEQLQVWEDTGYSVWQDAAETRPKPEYSAWMIKRDERLRAKGLVGEGMKLAEL